MFTNLSKCIVNDIHMLNVFSKLIHDIPSSPSSYISEKVKLANNVKIGPYCYLNGNISIGEILN